MAFAAVAAAGETRAYSVGPLKAQLITWSAASGDTSGTITAAGMTSVRFVILGGGLTQTAIATYSGNVVTLTFADPVATVVGQAIVYGV